MSLISDGMDEFGAILSDATGLPFTRDPATIIPPCIYLGAPTLTGRTQGGFILDVPVHLVSEGIGDAIADEWLMDTLLIFTVAARLAEASPSSLDVDGIRHPTYESTATITVRST